ncbi:MAG: hypothetical protein HY235_30615 [Acidobacteria bacterium]|nr:hypothetical protein [Acidobacteriota bacterium]
MSALSLLLLALWPALGWAHDPVETWHEIDSSWLLGKASLILHGQIRTNSRVGNFGYGRFGPMVQVPVRRLTLGGGYFYQESRPALIDWENSHRLFVLADIPIRRGVVSLNTRPSLERFLAPDRAFNRYRQWLRIQREGKRWMPFGYLEGFVYRKGIYAWRPAGGLRYQITPFTQLEFGYFFDWRIRPAGGPRHVLFTTLRFRWRE